MKSQIKVNYLIRHNGDKYLPGEIISIEENLAKEFVANGAAFFIGKNAETAVEIPDHEEETEDAHAVISDNFTLEELKEEAEALNFDLPSSVKTKKAIIDYIISEGKEQAFIDLLEDDE